MLAGSQSDLGLALPVREDDLLLLHRETDRRIVDLKDNLPFFCHDADELRAKEVIDKRQEDGEADCGAEEPVSVASATGSGTGRWERGPCRCGGWLRREFLLDELQLVENGLGCRGAVFG